MKRLVAVILTYNEADHIAACIESVYDFVDEVLVFDSFSTDETVRIAEQAGARVLAREFDHYAGQRNAALEAVKDEAEWVLFVDADERISLNLAVEIRDAMEKPGYAGWRIPRHNYIFSKLTMGAGWYPDYQTRLLRVGAAHYDPARKVHEVVILNGAEGTLEHHITHYNYRDARHFALTQRKYTAYEAQIMFEGGIRPKPQNYILQPVRHFIWRFFTLRGYQVGLHGLRLCLLMSWYELRKYMLLRRLWRDAE